MNLDKEKAPMQGQVSLEDPLVFSIFRMCMTDPGMLKYFIVNILEQEWEERVIPV